MYCQIYIFFLTSTLLWACKTDEPVPVASNIEVVEYEIPHDITRENSGFALFNDKDTNVRIVYHTLTDGYNLYLDGGEHIAFAINQPCAKSLANGEMVNNSLLFSQQASLELVSSALSCKLVDTTYVGVKVTFPEDPYREQFGWLTIIAPLNGYWIAPSFVWETANHQSIKVGQRE